jgi:predicted nucleic acid-binding protein
LKKLLLSHAEVALDTSVFIYHFEDHPRYRDLTGRILRTISRGECRAVVSELTLLELLVRPLKLERQDVADEYEALLSHFPNLELVPIFRRVVLRAAILRARYGLRTPDALILATAILQGATLAITNDRQWKRVEEVVNVACLDDFL